MEKFSFNADRLKKFLTILKAFPTRIFVRNFLTGRGGGHICSPPSYGSDNDCGVNRNHNLLFSELSSSAKCWWISPKIKYLDGSRL